MKPWVVFLTAILVLALVAGYHWLKLATMVPAPAVSAPVHVLPANSSNLSPSTKVVPPTSSQAELPIVTSVSANAAPAVPAAPAADPSSELAMQVRLELQVQFPKIGRLINNGDLAQFYQNYTPPAQFDSKQFELLQRLQDLNKVHPNPAIGQMTASAAQAWEDMINQIPVVNQAGDKATYTLIEASPIDGHLIKEQKTFVKIDGQWYIK